MIHEWDLLRRMAIAVALGTLTLGGPAAGDKPGPTGEATSSDKKAKQSIFKPGAEVKVTDPGSGELGYYKVYVPKEYTRDRAWPVIFCYHGQNGRPTTGTFKRVLAGKHYIIVGMGYYKRGKEGYSYLGTKDIQILRRVLRNLREKLSINPKRLLAGGFSKGGHYAAELLHATPGTWAGAAILGGGMNPGAGDKKSLAGKRVFIGCGDKDVLLKYAKITNTYYRSAGARVFYEVWPDTEHRMNTSSGKLLEWLLVLGPLGQAKSDLASARRAEKAGKLGKAYKAFLQIADISQKHEVCIAAKEAGEKIAKKAEKQLAEAEKAVSDKNYREAAKLLTRMTATYEGSKFAQQADQKLKPLRADPAVKAAIAKAELNAQADAIEARAKAAEDTKDYKKATELYERYVKVCEGAENYQAVKARLAELKADKRIAGTIENKEAARQCKGWLAMARNYIAADKPQLAVPHLKKIIERYGNTSYGEQAKALLETIKSTKQ